MDKNEAIGLSRGYLEKVRQANIDISSSTKKH
jgi:hypothetical protein